MLSRIIPKHVLQARARNNSWQAPLAPPKNRYNFRDLSAVTTVPCWRLTLNAAYYG
jgi:hypothetical protein